MSKRFVFLLQGLLFLSFAFALASPMVNLARRHFAQWQSHSLWESWKAAPTEVVGSGSPMGWLRIPVADVDTLVLNDATKTNLAKYPCVHRSSLQPGAPQVIMAHRDTHFRGLKDLEKGDGLTLEGRDGTVVNHVVGRTEIIEPDAVPRALEAADSKVVVLMTCWPFDYVGPAPKRILFHCREATDTAR